MKGLCRECYHMMSHISRTGRVSIFQEPDNRTASGELKPSNSTSRDTRFHTKIHLDSGYATIFSYYSESFVTQTHVGNKVGVRIRISLPRVLLIGLDLACINLMSLLSYSTPKGARYNSYKTRKLSSCRSIY